jgi:hypothetical protein
MANPLDATYKAALADPITAPYYLVKLGFDTPSRLSSRGQISWNSQTWLKAGLEVRLSAEPTIVIYNEGTTIGATLLAQGTAGRTVTIYQGYANDSAHPSPEAIFVGQMGAATIGEYVEIRCKRFGPKRTPRHYHVPPTFNHLPKSGTRIETPNGVVIIEAK